MEWGTDTICTAPVMGKFERLPRASPPHLPSVVRATSGEASAAHVSERMRCQVIGVSLCPVVGDSSPNRLSPLLTDGVRLRLNPRNPPSAFVRWPLTQCGATARHMAVESTCPIAETVVFMSNNTAGIDLVAWTAPSKV